ncbi:MAG: HDOD domain-containing protein [Nibricoccus sp.]
MTGTTTDTAIKERVLRLARKLPTSPHIFGRLGMLLGNMDADVEDIVKLASVDAGLTARVIRMSNSVFFRGDTAVSTLGEAIGRVGFREVHKIVGVAMTDQVFQSGLPVYNLTAAQMWENSVVTALAMTKLAAASAEDEGMAYTVGLLRPVGKLILDTLLQIEQPGVQCPETANFDLPSWERAWAGITSNDVGAMILEEWRMPESMHHAVRGHYKPDDAAGRMGALLHLACWVTREMGKGFNAENKQWDVSEDVLVRAGIAAEAVQNCVPETQEALEELKTQLKAG